MYVFFLLRITTPNLSALTSSFSLDSIPTKNAGAPACSITSGWVRLDAIAMLSANRAKVKSIEDKVGFLDAPTRKLQFEGDKEITIQTIGTN